MPATAAKKSPPELKSLARNVRTWIGSKEGRREIAAALEQVRQSDADLARDRQIDPVALVEPFTL